MSVTGLSRPDVVAGVDLDPVALDLVDAMLEQRRAGVPLQYLEGEIPFGPVMVAVDHRALIPRPETEYLFALASASDPPSVVVDLCTGGGCLALALQATFREARVVGTDISPRALSLARENATRAGLPVEWHVGDLYEALPRELRGEVELLVSNPPYVRTGDLDSLSPEVAEHEPTVALDGGKDGLDVIRRLIGGLAAWLAPGGRAIVEAGLDNVAEGAALARQAGFRTALVADLTGRPRYIDIADASG